MTVKHMRVFVTVYQEMNITRAAEKLHMTQPAVTRSIQELESHYGIHLFERLHNRLHRTPGSEDFYARALHIVQSFDELEKGAKTWEENGVLRIGASLTLGSFLLPGLIRDFQADRPQLRIQVNVSNTESIRQAVLKDAVDIGLVEGEVSFDYLQYQPLSQNRLQTIVCPGHPLLQKKAAALADVAACPLLLRESGSAGRTFLNHIFSFHNLTVQPLWESISTQALVSAVAAGLGVSILPEQLVQADVAAGRVAALHLTDEDFVRCNYLIWHKQKYLGHTARAFIQEALQRA